MDDIELIAVSALCLATLYSMLNEQNTCRLNQNQLCQINQNKNSDQFSVNHNEQYKAIQNKPLKKSNVDDLDRIENKRRRIYSGQSDTDNSKHDWKILDEKRPCRIEDEDQKLVKNMMKINRNKMKMMTGKVMPKKRRIRRVWTIKAYQRSKDDIENIFQRIIKESAIFRRMSTTDFDILLSKLEPLIGKQDTRFRICIPTKMRLAITLRFLSTGEKHVQLQQLFNISSSTIQRIINEVSMAILTVLEKDIKTPETPEEWLAIEEGYRNNFPHCMGTLITKRVIIQCSPKPSSNYYQYNNIIFFGVVDSNYNFIYADICKPNKEQTHEGGLLKNSAFLQKINNSNTTNLPPASPLLNGTKNVPYVFAADGVFGLEPHIMEPFQGYYDLGTLEGDFNQRLANIRVGIDNIFGLLTSVFGIFDKPIKCKMDKACTLVMCCVLLHNFLYRSETSRTMYAPTEVVDCIENGVVVRKGSWRNHDSKNCLRSLKRVAHNPLVNALDVRNEFANYFHNSNNS